MDLSTLLLLGIVGVLAVNQLVMRVGALRARKAIFYSLQAVDVLVGTAILWFHLPGLTRWPVLSWAIGLVFFLHAVQNNNLRARWLRQKLKGDKARRQREIRQALDTDE